MDRSILLLFRRRWWRRRAGGIAITAAILAAATAPAAAQSNYPNRPVQLIEGGKAQKMSKGDFMVVPAGVPHWFTNIDGNITEFSVHLPVK